MKRSLYPIIVFLWLGLLVGCSSPDESANKLFVEASKFVKEAQEAEKTSYADAFKVYQKASVNLEKIISKYPSSQLAVKITQGDLKIGPYTVTDFKETILSKIKIKADPEASPIDIALLVANAIKIKKHDMSRVYKPTALALVSGAYAETGQIKKASDILSQALDMAKTIKLPDDWDEYTDWALASVASSYVSIASSYAKAGQNEKTSEALSQAFDVAKTIETHAEKAWVLAKIARSYASGGQKEKASEIFSKALGLAKTIKTDNRKVFALAKIASSYADTGQKEKAFEILSLALDVVKIKTLKGGRALESVASSYASVASSYMKAGQNEKANEILAQALDVAKTIQPDYHKALALAEIASSYAKSGQKIDEPAKKILHEILKGID